MEKKSLHSPSLRRRNNRPGGGNRNRNRNRGGQNRNRGGKNRNSGQRKGGGGGNRSRSGNNRNRPRRRSAPKQTTGQKILSFLTFGLLGKPKASARTQRVQKKQEPAQTQRQKAREKAASKPKKEKKTRRNRTEVTSGRLYVGNLSYDTNEAELEDLFRGIGNVISAEVVTNARTQQSKGFAFVEMGSMGEAKRAVEILDDEDFMGRKLIVSGARSEGPREGDDEGSDDSPNQSPKEKSPSDSVEQEQTSSEDKSPDGDKKASSETQEVAADEMPTQPLRPTPDSASGAVGGDAESSPAAEPAEVSEATSEKQD